MEPGVESFSIPTLAESLRAIRPDCLILFALDTSHKPRYTVPKPHTRSPAIAPANQTPYNPISAHPQLKDFIFPPTAPTSHSQWSSRSTEYTRRSRICRPEATGSCRNSVERAWASSRSESLRTLYCKWGREKRKRRLEKSWSWTIADLVKQCKPERAPHRCRLLRAQHRDQERGHHQPSLACRQRCSRGRFAEIPRNRRGHPCRPHQGRRGCHLRRPDPGEFREGSRR